MKKIIFALTLICVLIMPVVYAGSAYDFVKWVFKPAITGFATGELSEVTDCDPEHKILICHVPPGDPASSRVLCVDIDGWNGHDQHPLDVNIGPITDIDNDGDIDDMDCAIAATAGDEICDGVDNDLDGLVDEDLEEVCGIDIGICEFGFSICENGIWSDCDGVEPDVEVCNGLDDDCDGLVDEGLVEDCGSDEGQCNSGEKICVNGEWGACGGGYVGPSQEVCDGVDNDCDGVIDNGIDCGCIDGQKRGCGSDVGECESGTQTCFLGEWGNCVGEVGPSQEVCDGVDNDCDGSIDEEVVQECGDYFLGECRRGNQVCENSQWGVCVGVVNPTLEICDNKDNDCDGLVDESLTEICGTTDTGECSFGTKVCVSGSWGDCVGAIEPGEEICDNKDNDCDTQIDENLYCECVNGEERFCGSDVGECRRGNQICENGQWGDCVGVVSPTLEVCDNKDNDCDGTSDEDLDCMCLDGENRECGTNEGQCVSGIEICTDGNWGICVGEVGPSNEICDGVDNDCDGLVDEDITRACGTDVGICERGVEVCTDGAWGDCVGEIGSSEETCNGLDDDCDGLVDDGIDCGCLNGETRECGTNVGECRAGIQYCVGGVWGGCEDSVEPAVEVCDGVDNDCDGEIDENLTRSCGFSDVGICEYGLEVCEVGNWSGECIGAVFPNEEVCKNSLDDDCDGYVDENCGGTGGGGGGGSSSKISSKATAQITPDTFEQGKPESPRIDVEFVEVPDIVDVVDDSFKARAVVTNVALVPIENVKVNLESNGDWISYEDFDLGTLEVGESEGVIFTLESDLCDKETRAGDRSFTEREFGIKVTARGDNAADADAKEVKIHIPKLAVSSAKTDYSEDNLMRTCFFINNYDGAKKDKVELEFELSDWKDDVLVDFISGVKTKENETLIKSKDYKLESVPRSKEYNLRAVMLENGTVFGGEGYVTAKAFNSVDLTEFKEVKLGFGELLLKFLGFIKR